MGNGIQPSETKIYIVAADTNASSLASSDVISGEIENWSLTGGEQEIEAVPVFGDGTTTAFLDKEKPRSQFEVSFDVYINDTSAATVDRWDIYKFGTGLTSATEGASKAIFISSTTGTSSKSYGFNNCRAVTWEPGQASDDFMKGTITFKFSPTTSASVANLQTSAVAAGSLPNWG
jgi:hypothetical protein